MSSPLLPHPWQNGPLLCDLPPNFLAFDSSTTYLNVCSLMVLPLTCAPERKVKAVYLLVTMNATDHLISLPPELFSLICSYVFCLADGESAAWHVQSRILEAKIGHCSLSEIRRDARYIKYRGKCLVEKPNPSDWSDHIEEVFLRCISTYLTQRMKLVANTYSPRMGHSQWDFSTR